LPISSLCDHAKGLIGNFTICHFIILNKIEASQQKERRIDGKKHLTSGIYLINIIEYINIIVLKYLSFSLF
jgi:hypothetical protein